MTTVAHPAPVGTQQDEALRRARLATAARPAIPASGGRQILDETAVWTDPLAELCERTGIELAEVSTATLGHSLSRSFEGMIVPRRGDGKRILVFPEGQDETEREIAARMLISRELGFDTAEAEKHFDHLEMIDLGPVGAAR